MERRKSEIGQTGILFALILGLLGAAGVGAYAASEEIKSKQTQQVQQVQQITAANETIQTQAQAIASVADANKAEAEALLEHARTIGNMAQSQSELAARQLADAQTREDAVRASEARLSMAGIVILGLFVVVAGGLMMLALYFWNRYNTLRATVEKGGRSE